MSIFLSDTLIYIIHDVPNWLGTQGVIVPTRSRLYPSVIMRNMLVPGACSSLGRPGCFDFSVNLIGQKSSILDTRNSRKHQRGTRHDFVPPRKAIITVYDSAQDGGT